MNSTSSLQRPSLTDKHLSVVNKLSIIIDQLKVEQIQTEHLPSLENHLNFINESFIALDKNRHIKIYLATVNVLEELSEVLGYLETTVVDQLFTVESMINYLFSLNRILKQAEMNQEVAILVNLEKLRLQPSPEHMTNVLNEIVYKSEIEVSFSESQIKEAEDKLTDYIIRMEKVNMDNKYSVDRVSLFFEKAGIELSKESFINIYVQSFVYYLGHVTLTNIELLFMDEHDQATFKKIESLPF